MSYSGRITIGSYAGRERLTEASAGTNANDVATLSARFFLRATEVTSQNFELVSDIRDKNDFFGLLNKELLQLSNENTFQIRQLSAKYPGSTFFTQLGRFPIPEAGAVHVDGILQGVAFSESFRLGIFGGLNPKRPEQTYLQFNSDSQVYGAHISYTPPFRSRTSSFYVDGAAVSTFVSGATERIYLYTNTSYQWQPRSRLGLVTYLDFSPNIRMQNATLNYQQELGQGWISSLTLLSIDALEYQRKQGVREQLPSSPFQEATARLRYLMPQGWNVETLFSFGRRSADGLERTGILLTSDFGRLLGQRWGLLAGIGWRRNFVSNDLLANLRILWASRVWEFDLSEEFAIEHYRFTGITNHPLISEISVSRVIENSLYGTLLLQDVRDERAKIISFFIKLAYRFGSNEIHPLRDGAPPMGRL